MQAACWTGTRTRGGYERSRLVLSTAERRSYYKEKKIGKNGNHCYNHYLQPLLSTAAFSLCFHPVMLGERGSLKNLFYALGGIGGRSVGTSTGCGGVCVCRAEGCGSLGAFTWYAHPLVGVGYIHVHVALFFFLGCGFSPSGSLGCQSKSAPPSGSCLYFSGEGLMSEFAFR